MSDIVISKEDLKRKAFLVKCKDKEALRIWVKTYFNVDLPPDAPVDPDSTTTPLDLLWEVYEAMESGDPEKTRFLFYAARDSGKTLASSIIELLAVLHFRRDVAHLAAVLSQSQVCARYIKQYTRLPIVRDFIIVDNERTIEIGRYKHLVTGEVISVAEFKELSPAERVDYEEQRNWIKVLVATLQGTNSTHAQILCIDELDIAPRGPIEEAKMIPTQCIDGKPPIVLMTSSRKFGAGFPVQDEIDAAGERGTLVRHWNLIDVTNRCDESRSLSDRPMIPIYYSDETLRRISEEEFLAMNVDQQRGFKKDMGYEGCLKNCRMFAACRSRLARRPFRKCRFLKPVAHVQTMFRSVDLDKAKAQLLCWKPSSHGMIYPRFDPFVHVVTAQQMAKMMTGDDNHGNITKAELVALAKTINLPFYAGLDHGFTHDFAVVTGIKDGSRLFVIDVISEPELELDQKIQTCSNQIGELDPIIFADPEDPASNKTLSRHFRLREWTKAPGSVVGGINIVRFKLNPTMGTLPQLYFLKDDPGVQKLISDMQKYHWALDSAGELTDQPDETLGMEDGRPVGDDRLDALRYMVMNVFPPKKKDGITISQDTSPVAAPAPKQYGKNDWMTTVIAEHTGMAPEEPAVQNGTKGGKFWTM